MRIRAAGIDDRQAIEDIVQRAYSPYVERIGRRPAPMDDDYEGKLAQGGVFVIEEESLAGLIVLILHQDHVLIENVAVDPPRQGRGLGRELLAFAEMTALAAGMRELRLYTNAAMHENLALYAGLGYREVDRRTDRGFERVFFSKRLDSAAAAGS